jgi:hypothetical protein
MELESSTQNVVLSLSTSPTYDEKNIFLGEASYRFIRIPVNHSTTRMSKNVQQQSSWIQSIATVTVKIHGVRKYKDRFHRFSNIRCRVWFEPQSIYYTRQTSKPSTKMKFARCIETNIQQVLANFNQKEIYIIEHLLGSMGESCYLQKR